MGNCICYRSRPKSRLTICHTDESHIYCTSYSNTNSGEILNKVTKHFKIPIELYNPHYTEIILFLIENPHENIIQFNTLYYDWNRQLYANNALKTPMPSVNVEMQYLCIDLFDALDTGYIKIEDYELIAESIINAILFLHENGILHSDIKLENFLVNDDRKSVRLIDFESASWCKSYCQNIVIRHTMQYISPEYYLFSIRGLHNDIWSLGHLLYMLFEGIDCFVNVEVCLAKYMPKLKFKYTPLRFQNIINHALIFNYKKRKTIFDIQSLLKTDNIKFMTT